MRCHACVIENELCTRVNTIQSFLEINRLLPHRLPEFGLQSTSVSRNKVSDPCDPNHFITVEDIAGCGWGLYGVQ